MDWEEFLNKILDGAFAVDIRKTGSSTIFIKNQLGRQENKHTEVSRFRKSLNQLIEQKAFTSSEGLREPEAFHTIIDLGIDFCGAEDFFAKKCAALYLQLSDFKGRLTESSQLSRQDLLIKSSLAITKFIESWKNQYEIIGEKNIYKMHGFLESVSKKWAKELGEAQPVYNPNILIGIIYLNEWASLRKSDILAFFESTIKNKELFGAILSDMIRVKKNELYNYFDFIKDCLFYHKEFYDAVSRRCPFWTDRQTETIEQQDEGELTAKVLYIGYTKNVEGYLNKDIFNSSVAQKIKEN